MLSPPYENVEKALGEFVQNVRRDPDHAETFWKVLRNEFIVIKNTKTTYDLTPKAYELINIIQARKDFNDCFGNELLNSVFPSMRFKVHLEDLGDSNEPLLKIKAPSIPVPKTPRISLTKSAIESSLKPLLKAPQTTRQPKKTRAIMPPSEPKEKRNETQPKFIPENSKIIQEKSRAIKEEQTTPWNKGFKFENEVDALTYVAATEPSCDFLQFHIGQPKDDDGPYSFHLTKRIDDKDEFESITRRGVTSIKTSGTSEFEPIDQFVTNKTQYNMLKDIKFFAQFKIHKTFKFWKYMTVRKTFAKRLDNFTEMCWNAKVSFPPIHMYIRKALFSLKDFEVFPIKKDGTVEYEDEKKFLYDAREDFAIESSKIAKEMFKKLTTFTSQVNTKYKELVTKETTNYMQQKKIPSELFTVYKVPSKKSLSMVEEKQNKVDYKNRVLKAKSEVEKIRNFFIVADKTVLTFFLDKLCKQFHVFTNTFSDQSHQMLLHITLDYEGGDIRFYPSLEELKGTLKEHIDTLFTYLSSFTRPILINPAGGEKELPLPEQSKTIKEFIQESESFKKDTSTLFKIIEESYKEANDSLRKYQPSARSVYKFKEGWEEMKRKETNPTVYIQNLTLLTNIQEQVELFKATYVHKLIFLDVKHLRTTIVGFLEDTIKENNTILFTNFANICNGYATRVNELMKTLVIPQGSLEESAQFNAAIQYAKSCEKELNDTVEMVNTIFNKAMTAANSLVPLLSTNLKTMRTASEKYEKCLADAQAAMEKSREEVLNKLMNNQKELEEKLEKIDQLFKEKFGTVNPQMQPEAAIAELHSFIDETTELSKEIEQFKVTAAKLNYESFNFDLVNKILAELKINLDNWEQYAQFMAEITSFTDSLVMEVDYKKLILFLNSRNEREMRSVHHPLFDRMANHFAILYQYLPFFVAITKIELTYKIWKGVFDILKLDYDEMTTTTLKKFINPQILTSVDAIRIFIMNLQQKADLSQTFDKFIIQMKSLVLTIQPSKTIKPDIITFPSIYEVLTTCESFQLYLRTLRGSQFYSSIEKQVLYWDAVLYQLVRILSCLLVFQTKYVIVSEATSALFGELHFPYEEQAKSFVDAWYTRFIQQVKYDPHVLLLITKVDPENPEASNPRKKKIYPDAINFEDILEKDFKKESLTIESKQPQIVNKEYEKPIYCGKDPIFQGEVLAQCLEEATTRCEYIMNQSSYLLDQQRQKFPRFFFCTDTKVIEILLACTNIRFIVNDLVPIFPSLSRFQCSGSEENDTIMGVIATNGEMLQFRSDFPYEGLQAVDLLERIEFEVGQVVRSSILEALSVREFTEAQKWIVRYPSQALIVAESIFFHVKLVKMLEKVRERHNWQELLDETEKFIKAGSQMMIDSPTKCSSIAAFTALKIRHRDILEDLKENDNDTLTTDSYLITKHIFHKVTNECGKEDIAAIVGNLSFKYGNELISDGDIGPMTDAEDEAILSFASCMQNAEFSVSKQMNGPRSLVKAFADLCGIPCFSINSKLISNVFPGVASCKCVLRLTDVNDLPAAFPNFFGLLEAKTKVMKCETHFRKLDLDTWGSLIHIDETNVPSWLMTRLRPIYLSNIPDNDYINKFMSLRPDIPIPPTIQVDFLSQVIKQFNARGIIHGFSQKEEGLCEQLFFFDVSEYILTNKVVPFKDPVPFVIPKYLKEKIDQLTFIFEKFDAFAPHSQSSDFPIIPFATSIDIVVKDQQMTMICIFAAIKESISIAKFNLKKIGDGLNEFHVVGCRPIRINMYSKSQITNTNAWISPEPNIGDVLHIALQQSEIRGQYQTILPHAENFINEVSETQESILNAALTKINLLRKAAKANAMYSVSVLGEAIFTKNLESVEINQEFEMKVPLSYNVPIVIQGQLSSGKREYVKSYILQHAKPEDLVFFSSPYNETIDMNIVNNLEFITRGLYGPKFDGEIYVCIFDVQNAIPDMIKFIKAFVMFKSVFFRTMDQYQTVEGIHLICTTTDISLFDEMAASFYMITDFPRTIVPFKELTSKNVQIDAIDVVKREIAETRQFKKASLFIKMVEDASNYGDFIKNTSILFGVDVAAKAAESYNFTRTQVLQLLNTNKNDCFYLPDYHLVSCLTTIVSQSMSAFVVTDDPFPITKLENIHFVVLNARFKTQLFTELVNSGEHKRKTVFLLDLQDLNINDVLNLMYFLMFNSSSPDYSTYFEQADIQIFKHYYDPEGKDLQIFKEILNLNSFLVICNEKEYNEKIPEIFKAKMITIRKYQYQELKEIPEDEENKYRETNILKPYLTIDTHLFEDIVTRRTIYFRDHFNIFNEAFEKMNKSLDEFIALKETIQNIGEGTVVTESAEKDYLNKISLTEAAIEEAKNTVASTEELLRKKSDELSEFQEKVSKEAPSKIAEIAQKLCDIPTNEQADQLRQWVKTKDPFAELFREMFSFNQFFILYEESSKSDNTKLIDSLSKFDYENSENYAYTKLENFGFLSDAPADKPIRLLMSNNDEKSPFPMVNDMKEWLRNIVKYTELKDKVAAIANEIIVLRETKEEQISTCYKKEDELKELKESLDKMKSKGYCPTWLMNAYQANGADMLKVMDLTISTKAEINKLNDQMLKTEEKINAFSLIYTAFQYGFSKAPLKERQEIYKDFGLASFLSPFRLIDSVTEYEMFCPLEEAIRAFTPFASDLSRDKNEEPVQFTTMQKFTTMLASDSLICLRVLPFKPSFIETFEIPEHDMPTPEVIFFDPLDIVLEAIIASYSHVSCAFTSSKDTVYEAYVTALSTGLPLVVHIDSCESVHEFFVFQRHIKLQIATNKKIIFDESIMSVAENPKVFFVTKLKDINEPGTIIANANIENVTTTRWFELACVFSINHQIEDAFVDEICKVDPLIKGIFAAFKNILHVTETSWREILENPQKCMLFKNTAESLMSCIRNYTASTSTLNSMLAPSNEHPNSIFRYSTFIELCRDFVIDVSDNREQMQAIAACFEFSKSRSFSPMAPTTVQNSISEITMHYINCLPAHERMMYLVNYERKFMSGTIQQQHLLFEKEFPKIREKPISQLMSQLMNFILQKFMSTPRSFFSFCTPDTLPYPDHRPVILELDDLIPSDLYSRAMSQYLSTKGITLLTVGSFSNQSLASPSAVNTILKGCKEKNAVILIIYDELMPKYIIPALLHNSHNTNYANYYILVNKRLYSSLPYIPNSLRVQISRPSSMFGITRFLNMTPYYHRANLKPMRPFLYFNLILSHRKDYPLRLQHILPMVLYTKEIWENNLMCGAATRRLWKSICTTLYSTMTPYIYTRKSFSALFEKFFKDSTPSMPVPMRLEIENESLFSSENPPTPNECGMMISYGDPLTCKAQESVGWTEKIKGKSLSISPVDNPLFTIKNATVVNARVSEDGKSLCSNSNNTLIDIYVTEDVQSTLENTLAIDVYDGNIIAGTVSMKFSGNANYFAQSSVFIQLPTNVQQ